MPVRILKFFSPGAGLAPLFVAAFLLFQPTSSMADDTLTLVIQPVYGVEKTRISFQPLAAYLAEMTGKEIKIKTYPNFITYWNETRDGRGYDLILDAAHFTGYRARELNFEILAKIQGTVSYSVIVPDSTLVMDIDELVGKKIASLGPPSMGAAKVSLLFDNPLRQPFIYETENSEQALNLLYLNEVDAAIIPTPLVNSLSGISVVTTTDPTQHIALSASPGLDENIRVLIRDALIHADNTNSGRQMLRKIGFAAFEHPDTERYVLAAELLQLTGIE